MNEEKLKIYVISIMAFRSGDALDLPVLTGESSEAVTVVHQLPGIVPASSIKAAAQSARAQAFDRWQPGDGWYGHQAAILPVTKDFYEKAFTAYSAGGIDFDNAEPGECFNF